MIDTGPISYFTDRESGPRLRVVDTIDQRVWGGLYTIISTRLDDGSFGQRFPTQCLDGYGACGCDQQAFGRMFIAEMPGIEWPLSPDIPPDTPMLLEVLEFCAAAIGQPIEGPYHSYYRHHHLTWNREAGLKLFVEQVNLLFARNGIAYELTSGGQARRILAPILAETLTSTLFATGDAETDRLLEAARVRIASPKTDDRQDALEKLWDAFERLKTMEPGRDKKAQVEALLDRMASSESKFREAIGIESTVLTNIGNTFRIRHSETSQELLTRPEQVDYLFSRMFAFIRVVLKTTGRGG